MHTLRHLFRRPPPKLQTFFRSLHTPPTTASVALLHQSSTPPPHNSHRHPPEPTGHRDACADIAFALQSLHDPAITVVTPTPDPSPDTDSHWSFPDSQQGILAALAAGATTLWPNGTMYPSHPLANLSIPRETRLVCHPLAIASVYGEKCATGALLSKARLSVPKTWVIEKDDQRSVVRLMQIIHDLPYPVVVKPATGRESRGVVVVGGVVRMLDVVDELVEVYGCVVIEELLEGVEGCVTVLPDGEGGWRALPVVQRFDHVGGVMPGSGSVDVGLNSRAVGEVVEEVDPWYGVVKDECLRVAEVLGLTSVARMDFRRKGGEDGDADGDEKGMGMGKFYLFDVNVNPDLTGPGRPGREGQTSLCAMAAKAAGWDYPTFVRKVLHTARPIGELAKVRPSHVFDSVEPVDFHVYGRWAGGK